MRYTQKPVPLPATELPTVDAFRIIAVSEHQKGVVNTPKITIQTDDPKVTRVESPTREMIALGGIPEAGDFWIIPVPFVSLEKTPIYTLTPNEFEARFGPPAAPVAPTGPAPAPGRPAGEIGVAPATATLGPGKSQAFSAFIPRQPAPPVKWTLTPPGVGSISTDGVYTAPATIPSPVEVTVTATTVAAPEKVGTATVKLVP